MRGLEFFVFYNGSIKSVYSFSINNYGGILFVSRLKSDCIIRLEEYSFEGGFVRNCKTDEAIITIVDLCGGREDDDVTFTEFRLHRITDDSNGKGVGVVEVGAADVIIGYTNRVV
jgi:hypothetical protein